MKAMDGKLRNEQPSAEVGVARAPDLPGTTGFQAAAGVASTEAVQPLVSVITPVFNMARTLQRAFDSVQAQNGRWEYIVVDDGSTDETPRVMEDIARDPRVVAIRTTNRGIGAALNTALDLASGDFVAFLDADDEHLPDHLSSHLSVMARNPDVDILWGGLEVVADSPDDVLVPNIEEGFGFISIHECVTQGTMFVRRRVFETVRFAEDRAYCHDYDFFRTARSRFNVLRLHEPTYRYYRNTSASVVDRLKANWPSERQETRLA